MTISLKQKANSDVHIRITNRSQNIPHLVILNLFRNKFTI